MLIDPDYKGFRIEINAIGVDGRWNAEVRIRRLFCPGVRRASSAPRGETHTSRCRHSGADYRASSSELRFR